MSTYEHGAHAKKNAKKKKKAVLATKILHAKKRKKEKKSKQSIVHATKRSKRGIEPAPLAVECTSVTSQTQRVIR